tara:strand:- start:531 stop:959 length:429 start_codon:yes stop_codon:yes gene_type:complete
MRVEKINSFNTKNLDQLREAINNSLKLIGRTFGIELNLTNISYSDYNFNGKLVANLESKNGELFTEGAIYYKKACEDYDLKIEWLGQAFVRKGQSFTIVGLKKRSQKYPVECVSNGKHYKFPASTVKILMAKWKEDNGTALL